MYYVPNTYSYPYYVHTQSYHADFMSRNHQQIVDIIFAAIKREASAVDLYNRLANEAPNKKHKQDILQALEAKKVHLRQFSDLYSTLTGFKPQYQIDKVSFNSYREGLQKAYEAKIKGSWEYQNSYLLTQYLPFRNAFMSAFTSEQNDATRFESLHQLKDYGGEPFVVNIEKVTKQNNNFRTALWTGELLQVTLMSIEVGEDIGLEIHPTVDQFLRIEEGQGLVRMGEQKDRLDFEKEVVDDDAIMIPAGKWHNLTNTGNQPLKLYSIYAPPEHPFGTVHETKAIAMAAEENHG